MITAAELTLYIETLKAAGVTGPVEIDGIKLTIAPAAIAQKEGVKPRSPKEQYDLYLFAATEGIPDDEVQS